MEQNNQPAGTPPDNIPTLTTAVESSSVDPFKIMHSLGADGSTPTMGQDLAAMSEQTTGTMIYEDGEVHPGVALPDVDLGDAAHTATEPNADTVEQSTTTTQTHPVYLNVEVNADLTDDESLAVLQVNTQRAVDIVEKSAGDESTLAARRWNFIIEQSLMAHPIGLQYESTLSRADADFRQYGSSPKGEIAIGTPRFGETGNKLLRGESARLQVRSMLGMGNLKTIPLWHSGFHITLKTPTDSRMLELRRRMLEDKIEFGRATHGLVFSNVSSYWTGYLLEMAMEHVHSHTLKDVQDPRDYIQTPDLPLLFAGLAATIWPQGFPFARADLTTAGKAEKKYVKGLININKITWVDNTQLTELQRTHMSNRVPGSMTLEQLEIYRKQFRLAEGKVINLGAEDNPVKVTLKVPPALSYIRSGHRWVTGLADIVERTFTGAREDASGRSAAILEHANATIMRQYAHWIASIEFEGSDVITDTNTLDDIIDDIAVHEGVREALFKGISQFIDDCTVALVGIPEANQDYVGPKAFPRIIPLDVVSAFFILLMRRTKKHTV